MIKGLFDKVEMEKTKIIEVTNRRKEDYINIAETFGRKIWSYKEILKMDDLMLYGSLVHGKKIPSDIDILLIHEENNAFEEMQKVGKSDRTLGNINYFNIFKEIISRDMGLDISFMMDEPLIAKSIEDDILNVNFLDKKIFADESYRRNKVSENEDPRFYNIIFNTGLLWDSNKFSITAKEKYDPDLFL